MPTTLRINITREVLEKTKDCKGTEFRTNCAISYAIRGIWPTAETVLSAIRPFGIWEENCIPHNQSDFIDSFDRATPTERAAMQPFSFDIDVPDEVINEVNIEEVKRICEGSKNIGVGMSMPNDI